MSSLYKFPGSVSQTTGGSYRTFSDLNNIKVGGTGVWANSSGNIKGKNSSPNRPSTISCTNFAFNLPTGAEVSKVTVEYRHRKNGSLNIGAPTITLLGVSGKSGKGVAPTTSMVTSTKSFTSLSRTQVNSSSFGVSINYPANSNSSEGTMSVAFVRILVEYKVPSYSLGLRKVSGAYNEETYTVEASISNNSLTSYTPTCTLTAPTGFSFDSMAGTGEYTVVNPTTISWNPKLGSKVGSSTAQFQFSVDVTYPSGQSSYTGTFTLSESLYSGSRSLSATITDRPSGTGEDVDPDAPISDGGTGTVTEQTVINVIRGEEFKLDLESIIGSNYSLVDRLFIRFYDIISTNISYDGTYGVKSSQDDYIYYYIRNQDLPMDGNWVITQPQKYKTELIIYPTTGPQIRIIFYINVLPSEEDLSTPNFAILEPSEEEYNLLGSGYTYIAQSDIKHTTTDTNVRDWYKNNRIGIFNNNIENISDYTALTDSQIIDNALYWSQETGGLNEYNSVECEFTYDSDYPLYVIMTGDYPEAEDYGYDMGTIKYDTPCIIEKQVYNGREASGNYPTPIDELLTGTDIATLNLAIDETTDPVILYDLPVEYGTDENIAIRGIETRINIEYTDDLIIQAKLHNPNGETGQRSVIINSEDEEIIIGGLGDLWGFTTLQMVSLDEWELELSTANILNRSEATLLINNIQIIFYLETIDKQDITITVNDEDIAYYGAFIENVNIPEGLNTDTSFLSIDGTDTNDAYRQNIREKQITIEFNLSNCELQTSTDMLRQLVKLFVNEKDQYNRPIPKRIHFSHYPHDYFEYIMEEPFDVDTELTDYNIKATLTIPSGTSYALEDTVTNTTGNANGLAAINPQILIRPSGATIQVKENNTGQTFQMTYDETWNGSNVLIDCEDRTVSLIIDEDTSIDISQYADYNNDWFRLDGEYEFTSSNCTILSVSFTERW